MTGGGFTSGSSSIQNTGLATGSFTIKNIGGATSVAQRVSFYFSTNATIDKSANLFLGNVSLTPIQGNGSLPGSYSFSLFQTDTTDPSVRNEFVQYWAARGQVGTKVSGFIGMIIDPSGLVLDANPNNNKNQGVNLDRVVIDVTIAQGTTT